MFEFSNIKFLVHVTSRKNLEGILESGYILTNNELIEKKIDYSRGFSQKQESTHDGFYRHYPGIYMTVFTYLSQRSLKDYNHPDIKDPVFILFKRELLLNKDDYHINTCDFNGYIIPPFLKNIGERTFLNSQLSDFILYCNNSGNDVYDGEIVFHSKVSIKNFMVKVLSIHDEIPNHNEIPIHDNFMLKHKNKIHKFCIKFTPMNPSYFQPQYINKKFLVNYIYYLVDLGFISVNKIKELINVKSDDEILNSLMCINQILENKFKEYRDSGCL